MFFSVSILVTSSIIFEAVELSVFTIISATISVKSSTIGISVIFSSCIFTASIVCSIKRSFISSSIMSIFVGSVSTIAFNTLADKFCFSSVDDLLTSSTTLLTMSSLVTATTFAIKSTSSFDALAF